MVNAAWATARREPCINGHSVNTQQSDGHNNESLSKFGIQSTVLRIKSFYESLFNIDISIWQLHQSMMMYWWRTFHMTKTENQSCIRFLSSTVNGEIISVIVNLSGLLWIKEKVSWFGLYFTLIDSISQFHLIHTVDNKLFLKITKEQR